MKHITTTLLILLSFTLFGQDGGTDQIKIKTNYLQIDSLQEISPTEVKVLIVDDNSKVGYTTTLPGVWYDNGNYIEYKGGSVVVGESGDNKDLYVYGKIYSKEVKVQLSIEGPDYVFEPDYKLMKPNDLRNYLDKNKHLPEIPSAKEMEKDGIKLSEMNMLLLKKVEELTLYMLEQQKEIDALKKCVKTRVSDYNLQDF